MVRVFEEGVVDASKLIFVKSADATDADVLDALKTNGYKLRSVQDVTVDSNLA